MTTSEPTIQTPTEPTVVSREARYSVAVQLLAHSEIVSWTRVYNFLVVGTLLIVAWTAALGIREAAVLPVMNCVALIGAVFSAIWVPFGWRSRLWVDHYVQIAKQLEGGEKVPGRTGADAAVVRDDLKSFWTKPFRSKYITPLIPLVFLAMFVFLLCQGATLVRAK